MAGGSVQYPGWYDRSAGWLNRIPKNLFRKYQFAQACTPKQVLLTVMHNDQATVFAQK